MPRGGMWRVRILVKNNVRDKRDLARAQYSGRYCRCRRFKGQSTEIVVEGPHVQVEVESAGRAIRIHLHELLSAAVNVFDRLAHALDPVGIEHAAQAYDAVFLEGSDF